MKAGLFSAASVAALAAALTVLAPLSARADVPGLPEGGCDGTYDVCGVCDGDGTSCRDCAGTPNGDAEPDSCGVCNGPGPGVCSCNLNDGSCVDCKGVPNGTATMKRCGCDDGITCNCDEALYAAGHCPTIAGNNNQAVTQAACINMQNLNFNRYGFDFEKAWWDSLASYKLDDYDFEFWTKDRFEWWHYSGTTFPTGSHTSGFFVNNYCQIGTIVCGCKRLTGCFAPGTRILMHDGSEKLIDEIAVGDLVWNPVAKRAVRVQYVIEGAEENELLEIKLGDSSLTVSDKHPFPTLGGYQQASLGSAPGAEIEMKQARDLRPGDVLRLADGSARPITSIRRRPMEEGQYVINILLDTPSMEAADHMVAANGVATGDLVMQSRLEGAAPAAPAL